MAVDLRLEGADAAAGIQAGEPLDRILQVGPGARSRRAGRCCYCCCNRPGRPRRPPPLAPRWPRRRRPGSRAPRFRTQSHRDPIDATGCKNSTLIPKHDSPSLLAVAVVSARGSSAGATSRAASRRCGCANPAHFGVVAGHDTAAGLTARPRYSTRPAASLNRYTPGAAGSRSARSRASRSTRPRGLTSGSLNGPGFPASPSGRHRRSDTHRPSAEGFPVCPPWRPRQV